MQKQMSGEFRIHSIRCERTPSFELQHVPVGLQAKPNPYELQLTVLSVDAEPKVSHS